MVAFYYFTFIILRICFKCFAKVEPLTKVMWPKNRDFRGVQDYDDCNPTYFPSNCHEPNKLLPRQAHVVILQFHLWGIISWPGEFVLLTSSGVSQYYQLNNFCFMPCIIRIILLSFYHSTYLNRIIHNPRQRCSNILHTWNLIGN